MKTPFYFQKLCDNEGKETVEFGLENSDEYCQMDTYGNVIALPQEANEEFKSLVEFISKERNEK